MTVQIRQRMTVQEFDAWVLRPENVDTDYEYIGGEIVDGISNSRSSHIASLFNFFIMLHIRKHNLGGYVTGADGGYKIMGERYIPDVVYVSQEKQPILSNEAYNSIPPDLVIEVLSPTNDDEKMRIKVTNYLLTGAVVWVANPDERTVEVYQPGVPVQILTETDILCDDRVLPGFAVTVSECFPLATNDA